MSASLLRKGLELLETTGVSSSQPKRAATTAQSNKQLLKRTKKKKLFSQSKRETSTVKGKVTKSALEEYRKCQAIDHFQENMLYMMNNQFVADSTITQKILAQNRGRKAIDNPQEKAKKKPESTVFTEEDFKKFEREYFGGAGRS
ncbi:Active regulator of SIRT1 [Varanus komodoensis]|uniref:active regulator of SIRT1 n=1 Tax=Varanus komodoensis TaxID=61221 RepID=UPI001CF7B17C|nr:active regulator of SIRT1 [Varanus komodoensis]KAF7248616.1 Active regulator of SIRT1 [Varanus komodoensis]